MKMNEFTMTWEEPQNAIKKNQLKRKFVNFQATAETTQLWVLTGNEFRRIGARCLFSYPMGIGKHFIGVACFVSE